MCDVLFRAMFRCCCCIVVAGPGGCSPVEGTGISVCGIRSAISPRLFALGVHCGTAQVSTRAQGLISCKLGPGQGANTAELREGVRTLTRVWRGAWFGVQVASAIKSASGRKGKSKSAASEASGRHSAEVESLDLSAIDLSTAVKELENCQLPTPPSPFIQLHNGESIEVEDVRNWQFDVLSFDQLSLTNIGTRLLMEYLPADIPTPENVVVGVTRFVDLDCAFSFASDGGVRS